MLKRELKVNFKNYIIWLTILILIFLVVYLMYPSILQSNQINKLDEMLKIFPEEVLKSFNLDIASMDSAFGWIKTEGWVFVLLITGIYSSILGSNILLKEENDKTIEYLANLPISRTKIVISKFICSIIYITILVLLFAVFNYIALTISGEFNTKEFILLSITPLFPSYVLFTLSLFISTFFRKTKKIIGLSLGITFISYILNMLSTISTSVSNLKYLSVFTLADTRNVLLNSNINISMVLLTILLVFFLLFATIYNYNKKEFL